MRNTKALDEVRGILERYPATRSDNFALITEFAKLHGLNNYPFDTAMKMWQERHISPIETVTRARRKLQEMYPALRATDKVQRQRAESAERDRQFYGQQRMF